MPPFIVTALREGLRAWGRVCVVSWPDALLIAAETRTSAPVRIVRDDVTLQSPGIEGLYPCGEGAGYAGGIVSAALDGAMPRSSPTLDRGRVGSDLPGTNPADFLADFLAILAEPADSVDSAPVGPGGRGPGGPRLFAGR